MLLKEDANKKVQNFVDKIKKELEGEE